MRYEDFLPKDKMHINGVISKFMDAYVRDHLVWTPEQMYVDFISYLKENHLNGWFGNGEYINGELVYPHKKSQTWLVSSYAHAYIMNKFNGKYEKHKVLARKKAPLTDRIRLGHRWDSLNFYDISYGLKNYADYEKADIVEKNELLPWTIEHVNQQLKSKFSKDLYQVLVDLSKSEIEINFYNYWLDVFYKDPLSPALLPEVCGDRELYFCHNYRDEYALEPLSHWTFFEECKLINIRFDFAVVNWYKQTKLLIELDGHEYHKTVEQRNNDAIKRTIATNRGWQLNVFTGTQIKRDIENCFKSIKKFLER